MQKTRVIGCRLTTSDLCYVRIETALLSIAFDSIEDVVLYTRVIVPGDPTEDISKDKKLLKNLLGPLFLEDTFGIHKLRGGGFEVVIPGKEKTIPIPSTLVVEADSKFNQKDTLAEGS